MSIQVVYTKVFVIRNAIFFRNSWSLTVLCYSLMHSPFFGISLWSKLRKRPFRSRLPKRPVF